MQNFRKLKVWDRSIEFTTKIYKLTENFPKSEMYGLVSQIRRAAVSISLNIAEGCGCHTKIEFKRFLIIALRSCYEMVSALEISKRLQYGNELELDKLFREDDEISAMINGLIKKL
ncbi:MAG: four helix bundle protein [Patescibacteria group bacterium]|nr:four helix bundle protein [Patescibacteria group bacterium]